MAAGDETLELKYFATPESKVNIEPSAPNADSKYFNNFDYIYFSCALHAMFCQ